MQFLYGVSSNSVQQVLKNAGIKSYVQKESDSKHELPMHVVQPFSGKEKSRNHWVARPKDAQIKALIIHYTASGLKSTMRTFTSGKVPRVSPHYSVTEEEEESDISGGHIIQLVDEKNRAAHAGVSQWRDIVQKNKKGLNDYSIGIENVNLGWLGKKNDYGKKDNIKFYTWHTFDKNQVVALGNLCKNIVQKYDIDPANVLGHADIATSRNPDPGPLFPWKELHEKYGVGAWLKEHELDPNYIKRKYNSEGESCPKETSETFVLKCLEQYGYHIPDGIEAGMTKQNHAVLQAFRAHFSCNMRPQACYSTNVTRRDMVWAYGLANKYSSYKTHLFSKSYNKKVK